VRDARMDRAVTDKSLKSIHTLQHIKIFQHLGQFFCWNNTRQVVIILTLDGRTMMRYCYTKHLCVLDSSSRNHGVIIYGHVRLSLSASQSAVFFSHNKSVSASAAAAETISRTVYIRATSEAKCISSNRSQGIHYYCFLTGFDI
jgi:hypothetical protein